MYFPIGKVFWILDGCIEEVWYFSKCCQMSHFRVVWAQKIDWPSCAIMNFGKGVLNIPMNWSSKWGQKKHITFVKLGAHHVDNYEEVDYMAIIFRSISTAAALLLVVIKWGRLPIENAQDEKKIRVVEKVLGHASQPARALFYSSRKIIIGLLLLLFIGPYFSQATLFNEESSMQRWKTIEVVIPTPWCLAQKRSYSLGCFDSVGFQ